MSDIPIGQIRCEVENYHSVWRVKFDSGKTILIQTDYDQASFAVNAGYITPPKNWTGCPSALGADFYDFDCSIIEHCPEEYADNP